MLIALILINLTFIFIILTPLYKILDPPLHVVYSAKILCSLTNCLGHAVGLKLQVQQPVVWLMTFLTLMIRRALWGKWPDCSHLKQSWWFVNKFMCCSGDTNAHFVHMYKGCFPAAHEMQPAAAASTFLECSGKKVGVARVWPRGARLMATNYSSYSVSIFMHTCCCSIFV